MDILEQEKQRLLREYHCETIHEVLELLQQRLAALKNARKSAQNATSAPTGNQPLRQINASEAKETAQIRQVKISSEPPEKAEVSTQIYYIGGDEYSNV